MRRVVDGSLETGSAAVLTERVFDIFELPLIVLFLVFPLLAAALLLSELFSFEELDVFCCFWLWPVFLSVLVFADCLFGAAFFAFGFAAVFCFLARLRFSALGGRFHSRLAGGSIGRTRART